MNAALKLHRDRFEDDDDDADALAPARPKAPPVPPAPTAPSVPPAAWNATLVALLARLEDRRGRLPGRVRGNAAAILDATEGMVADCEAVAADAVFAADLTDLQTEALAKAGAFLLATGDSRQAAPVGVFRSMWSKVTARDDGAAPQIRACALAACETLSAYFTLFTRAFPKSALARDWVEAASAFLGEFNTQIRDLPE